MAHGTCRGYPSHSLNISIVSRGHEGHPGSFVPASRPHLQAVEQGRVQCLIMQISPHLLGLPDRACLPGMLNGDPSQVTPAHPI